jgi:ketosteroid isomerase-like protein
MERRLADMAEDERRARNRATFVRSLAALSEADLEGHLAGCTDDFVLELPYADPPVTVKGKEAVRAYLTPALATFAMQLDGTDFFSGDDPDVLVAEYVSVGHVTTTGKPYANSYIAVVRFRDDLICGQREYYNPVPALKALAPD